jgi:hypothetical protein
MLSIHLRLGLPSGLFPSGFLTNNLYTFLLFRIRATCSAHLILLDLIIHIILGVEYKWCISSLCSFLHPPVPSSLFGPNILLSTLFSNTLNLCSSLNVRVHVSYPCRTTSKIIVLYSNLYIFRQHRRRQKVLYRMVACFTRIQSPLNFLLKQILICYSRSQILELWGTFSNDLFPIFISQFWSAFCGNVLRCLRYIYIYIYIREEGFRLLGCDAVWLLLKKNHTLSHHSHHRKILKILVVRGPLMLLHPL